MIISLTGQKKVIDNIPGRGDSKGKTHSKKYARKRGIPVKIEQSRNEQHRGGLAKGPKRAGKDPALKGPMSPIGRSGLYLNSTECWHGRS